MAFYDLETVEGMAEGAFYSVSKIPSTVIEHSNDILARWDGQVPLSEQFKELLVSYALVTN